VTSMLKGPFSYSGNKTRIWKHHLKDVMSSYEKIHEPFVGSGVCVYNSSKGGNCIDVDHNVVALHNGLKLPDLTERMIQCHDQYFSDSSDMSASYLRLREDFNNLYRKNQRTDESNVHMLYVLIQLSFNSLLRFSMNGYNVPYGFKGFDPNRVESHIKVLSEKEIVVKQGSYSDLPLSEISKDKDLIYLDPPYVASKFQYGGWNKKDEIELLSYIDYLNSQGYRFILSNTFSHRGEVNQDLIDWSKNYNTRFIKMTYNAWSSRVPSVMKDEKTSEVLITNIDDIFLHLKSTRGHYHEENRL
jgi:DNA adenine methylase Dam